MGATIIVNMRTVVHKSSGGKAIASAPDVCKTPSPGGPIPIPYPNIAQSTDTNKGSKKVELDGNPIMLKNSEFSTSTGDEGGTAGGGIVSSKIKGKAKFVTYSFDVKVEKKNVARLLDSMTMNGNSPNDAAAVLVQGNITVQTLQALAKECEEKFGQPADPKDCKDYGRMKHKCCADAINEELEKNKGTPPELYSEPAFDRSTGQMIGRANPLGNIPHSVPRTQGAIVRQAMGFARTIGQKASQVIGGFVRGLKFPDIVVPIDPSTPIGQGNCRAVYDFKFPCKDKADWDGDQDIEYAHMLQPQQWPTIITP